jgi:hypothetical protein
MPSFIPRMGLFVERTSIQPLLLPLALNLHKAVQFKWKELHFTNLFTSFLALITTRLVFITHFDQRI